ncbi:bifunctional folylpolyglutamate synthase/dihydrofolate synthase [Senegalia massiliensis]|uniref:bifunctional folylpolyglutamate synthase/dihydrofolate synthase n=1 Tax=Senegalia massiliensis TaxID=1720316 RepID=UPI001031A97E|nr:folylpolyglutamate synthase/dihydrofolate synthase family protein [Senegalia massiliensis]
MNYNKALEFIHGTRKFGSKLGLDNIKKLLELLGNPHDKLKFIHIAGTNGKGSTTSFISSILFESGYKVGAFTSPYLEVFNERIRINNQNISDKRLSEVTLKVKEKVEQMLMEGYNHPTEFEIVTAIAFVYFLEEKTDIIALEVGLGGRYDSTNIIGKPLISVITPISLDHMDILGDTIEKIAYEKAGIIKENSKVISYTQQNEAHNVLVNVSKEKRSEIMFLDFNDISIDECNDKGSVFNISHKDKTYGNLKINLIGKYQVYNASLAVKTLLILNDNNEINISEENIRKGLENTAWMGRLEIINNNPKVVIDGAHNEAGAKSLVENIENLFEFNKLILLVGMLKDKEVDKILSIVIPHADNIIVTKPRVPRAMSSKDLAKKINKINQKVVSEESIEQAIKLCFDEYNEGDLIVASGSLYLIGEVRKLIKER